MRLRRWFRCEFWVWILFLIRNTEFLCCTIQICAQHGSHNENIPQKVASKFNWALSGCSYSRLTFWVRRRTCLQHARLNAGISNNLGRQSHLKYKLPTWMPNIARFFARLDGHLHRFGTIIETNVVLYLSASKPWKKQWKSSSLSPVRFLRNLKMFHFYNGFTKLRTVGKCDFVRVNTQRLSKH